MYAIITCHRVPVDATAPNSYKSNNAKEHEILQYAENFRRQFVHLYRDRKPLFLAPPNEFVVEVGGVWGPGSGVWVLGSGVRGFGSGVWGLESRV